MKRLSGIHSCMATVIGDIQVNDLVTFHHPCDVQRHKLRLKQLTSVSKVYFANAHFCVDKLNCTEHDYCTLHVMKKDKLALNAGKFYNSSSNACEL
jgi:hypothetical protein